MNKYVLFALVFGLCACAVQKETYQLAPHAPTDAPYALTQPKKQELDSAVAPLITKARATYPSAKQRYLAGLPRGYVFFVTIVLSDSAGRIEQIFLHVHSISGDVITGSIANDLLLVKGYSANQALSVKETEIIDWTISKPDGTEEGNLIGKYVDSVNAGGTAAK